MGVHSVFDISLSFGEKTVHGLLEPDASAAVKSSSRLALGDLGHVELQRAWVGHGRLRGKTNSVAGVDGVCGCASAGGELVAADLGG